MNELIIAAEKAVGNSYSPYSGFAVGAALLCSDGKIFTGCNIENASFSPTVCAERTALFKAVSEGEKKFEMIAVCGGKDGKIKGIFPPCGVCRRVMSEFCPPDMPVLLMKSKTAFERTTLAELIPYAFSLKN